MSDVAAPEVPEVNVEEDAYKVEIVEEEGGSEVDAAAELEAKNAELQAQLEELKRQQESIETNKGFEALAEELKNLKAPAPAPEVPQDPAKDFNAIIEETSKTFYNDPTKSVLNLLTPVVTQLQTEAEKKAAAQDMQISKLTVLATPGDKDLYAKYSEDVESIVKTLPPSATAYQEALKKVQILHQDEIIEEKVQAKVQEALQQATNQAQAAVQAGTTVTGQVGQAPISLAGMPKTAAPKAKSNALTAAQWNDLKQQAMIKGFDIGDPNSLTADGVWAIERYKKNGGRL